MALSTATRPRIATTDDPDPDDFDADVDYIRQLGDALLEHCLHLLPAPAPVSVDGAVLADATLEPSVLFIVWPSLGDALWDT